MSTLNKTFLPTKKYDKRNWFLINCHNQKLGRLASIIIALLKGKIKPQYCPSIDIGDYIVLINVKSLIFNKKQKHFFVNVPGHPGSSLKIRSVISSSLKLTIEKAIKGMLSNRNKNQLLQRIMIFSNHHHPYETKNLIEIDLSKLQ